MAYGKKIISVCLTVIMLASLLMLGLSMGMEAYAENSKVEDAQNSVVRVLRMSETAVYPSAPALRSAERMKMSNT